MTAIIYMPLLNEGLDVWRPVNAERLTDDTYRVLGEMPADEEWAGSAVRCEHTIFAEGEGLAAIEISN